MKNHEVSWRRVAARVAVTCVALVALSCDAGSRLADGITKEGLLSLRPGLSHAEVVQRLGPPLTEKRKVGTPFTAGDGTSVEAVRLTYGEPGFLGGGFELWVLLHDGEMVSAGCEEYDLGIYRCDRNGCPVIWDERALNRLPTEG